MGSGTRSNAWNIHSYDLAKYSYRRIGQKFLTYGLEGMLPSLRGPLCCFPSPSKPENEQLDDWSMGADSADDP